MHNMIFNYPAKNGSNFIKCVSLCEYICVWLWSCSYLAIFSLYVTSLPSLAAVEQIRLSLSLWSVARQGIYFIIFSPSLFPLLVFRTRYQEGDRSRGRESWRCRCRPTTLDCVFALACCSHLYVGHMSSQGWKYGKSCKVRTYWLVHRFPISFYFVLIQVLLSTDKCHKYVCACSLH